jgi:HlyD family secretion protein
MTEVANPKRPVHRFAHSDFNIPICFVFRISYFVFLPALACCALLSTLGGCRPSLAEPGQTASAGDGADPPVRVAVARPVRKALRPESVQFGWIEAFERTPLWAKLPAYVEKLYVDIGDRVEPNQVLADLSIPEMQDELRQKEAQVAQAQAGIEQAAAAVRAAEAAQATAQAKIAEAAAGNIRADGDYQRWKSQYARIGELVAGGSLDRKLEDETRNSLQAAEAARGEASAKVQSAKAALLENKADVAKAHADQSLAAARLQSAQADLARQKALLQYTHLRAPYSGVITERNVVRGDFVQSAGTASAKPLLAVARTDLARIFVDVPEMDSPWVEAGRPAHVTVEALGDRVFEGKVARTSWLLGPNRTLRTEVDLPNPGGLLRPGMYATAHIVLQDRPAALVLPQSAVVGSGKQAFCWTVRQGKAAKTPIALGLQVAGEVEVISGLTDDASVVQSPPESLREGQAVEH